MIFNEITFLYDFFFVISVTQIDKKRKKCNFSLYQSSLTNNRKKIAGLQTKQITLIFWNKKKNRFLFSNSLTNKFF